MQQGQGEGGDLFEEMEAEEEEVILVSKQLFLNINC